MADQERPLPKPAKRAFGFQKDVPEQGGQDLLADRMAAAAAAGKLDEFLKEHMPDSEHAQTLAKMMMGMTGMLPAGAGAAPPEERAAPVAIERSAMSMPPEEVLKAVQGADVRGLIDLLRREHQKRSPDAGAVPQETEPGPPAAPPASQPQPVIDRDLIDDLIRIAADNNVTLDWLILRAVKVYVEEHRKTGKL